ncbi:MAG: hypothetical protein KGN79_03615, partial [Acidobacteriota bacterium]|nr:hypothetical protein [Acidobacteriota bacterium]
MIRYSSAIIAMLALFVCVALVTAQQPAPAKAQPDFSQRWVDNTSGPMYTGTADVMPRGSFYFEPYYFSYRTHDSTNTTIPLKLSYGIGHRTELDATTALEYVGSGGIDGSSVQFGDSTVQAKIQLAKESDRYHFWTLPSIGLSVDVNIPTGHMQSSKPTLAGGAQTTNDTWNEQFNLLLRKQFKPFQLYLEGTEIIQNPVDVVGPYQFNNGITSIDAGVPFHVVDGNVIAASGAIEHVLHPKSGLGYLIEVNGERQSGHSLIFGKATAPPFSYVNITP